MEIFEKVKIGSCELNNRVIRSATFEGMCDSNGFPTSDYIDMYNKLSKNNIGGIITGFAYISKKGKAMQPGQAGIDSDEKIPGFRKLTEIVHKNKGKIFLQIAHTGRQTLESITGESVVGCSDKKSSYFKQDPKVLDTEEIFNIIDQFGKAAYRAREAGFDGIQLHAAHGYLIHQFLLPSINNRQDEFGINKLTQIGSRFLELIIDNLRNTCGKDFPILIKISGGDDYRDKFSKSQFINLIKLLDQKKIDAIEISYGTMDYPMNIFRGDLPVELILKENPLFKHHSKHRKKYSDSFLFQIHKMKLKPFEPMYNLNFALLAKQHTTALIITVGGFRNTTEINHAVADLNLDFVSLSRPFLAEPDLVSKLKNGGFISQCQNCNYCAVMCDSNFKTKCYKN